MTDDAYMTSNRQKNEREIKVNPLTKTSDTNSNVYDYDNTVSSFNKPKFAGEKVAEISTMRNQMKLIKARSHNKNDQEEQMDALQDELKQLNFSVKNINSGQEASTYAIKPTVARNRSIAAKETPNEEPKYSINDQASNVNRNPFQSKNQINSTIMETPPIKQVTPVMINMNRRRRDDDGQIAKKSGGLELFLPEEGENQKINVLKNKQEPFSIKEYKSNIIEDKESNNEHIKSQFQITETNKESQSQFQTKEPASMLIQKQSLKEIPEPYIPSIGDNVAEKSKRNTLPGSRNVIDEKPAVAQQEKVEEQLKYAELQTVQEEELDICPEGCGRSFILSALEKHIKVCKAVFQAKRKEFNSKNHRIVTQDQQKLQRQGLIKDKQNQKQIQNNQQSGGAKKWKEQSEQFRSIVQNKVQVLLIQLIDDQDDEKEQKVVKLPPKPKK